MTLKISDPRLAVWLTSNPMRPNGEIIPIVVATAALTFVIPWVIHPESPATVT